MGNINIKTSSGFKASVKENALKDMKLLRLIAKLVSDSDEETDIEKLQRSLLMDEIVVRLLTEKGRDDLERHIENKSNGTVDPDMYEKELTDIVQQLGGAEKKS